jgi:hypothetical protein
MILSPIRQLHKEIALSAAVNEQGSRMLKLALKVCRTKVYHVNGYSYCCLSVPASARPLFSGESWIDCAADELEVLGRGLFDVCDTEVDGGLSITQPFIETKAGDCVLRRLELEEVSE